MFEPRYTGSHALIVGINAYAHPAFRSLDHAESDAQALADLLTRPPYDFHVTSLLGGEATRMNVLRALKGLRDTHQDDRIIVYFACHGYPLFDRAGDEVGGFLACADTIPDEDFTALRLDEVTELRRYAGAKHIAFIFDACYSSRALGLGRPGPSPPADRFLLHSAYQVLSAGSRAVADFHSMTAFLLDALRG